jgi:pilus assembly protein CpaB
LSRRLIGLVVALVLAAIATIVIINYVTTADERAREAEELAEVFTAQEDIPAGTSADDAIAQGLVGSDEVPARTVPRGAVTSLDQIEGQVVVAPIGEREILVMQRFGETVARIGDQLDIPDGQQAVSVQVSAVPAVAGFVEAGDMVSIVATIEGGDEQEAPTDDGEPTGARTQFLLQNVEVLALGQRVVSTEGEGTSSIQRSNENYIFTLALDPEDVEKLVFANSQGTLWFSLLPDDEQPEADTPGRSLPNAFN